MSDPSKPFPLDDDILQSMVPWKEGDDYTSWRINTLANNLTNARYFNYTLVDAVKPDPIEKPLELPPDIQTLLDQQQISEQTLTQDQQRNKNTSAQEVTQNVVDEKQFAGTQPDIQQASLAREQQQVQDERKHSRNSYVSRPVQKEAFRFSLL